MKIRFIYKMLKFMFVTFFLVFIFSQYVVAGQDSHESFSWGFLVIGLFGGLALFLYGMGKMSDGMKKSAGNRLRSILAALTRNRFEAFLVGAFVTMIIQSSSATTVMLVSFVQAGLMSFGQSLGVILGADIGTTVTAQLIAFKLTDYALLMIAIGFGLQLVAKTDDMKNTGEIILGFGILFYGMKLMSDSMEPLRSFPGFINVMKELGNPLLGLLIGTIFTALVQSSSATTGVVIVLAHQGLINLDSGIPIIFGANIGTCITAGLASINASREAKRVALAHVVFKIAGVIIFIFWIPSFAEIIQNIAEIFGSDVPRQIANAHTIFNVSLGIIFLPLTKFFSLFILWIFPDKMEEVSIKPRTWYLDESSITSPALAIDLARAEISHMAETLGIMLRSVIIPFISDENLIKQDGLTKEEIDLLIKEIPTRDEFYPQLTLLEGIEIREQEIDFLDEKINAFLIQIARQETSEEQANEIYGMISISNDMESMGDLIDKNMIRLIEKKRNLNIDFSIEGKEELMIYHHKVCQQIDRLQEAFSERDLDTAQKIMRKERKYLDLEAQYQVRHLERLRVEREESVNTHEVHMELMDILKQIIVYSANIAKTFLLKCGPAV